MGADALHVFYGLRYIVGSHDELERLERRDDPRLAAARSARLNTTWGRPTSGEPAFLLIGHSIGTFGVENAMEATITDDELRPIVEDTKWKLADAGFHDTPKFIFQLETQY